SPSPSSSGPPTGGGSGGGGGGCGCGRGPGPPPGPGRSCRSASRRRAVNGGGGGGGRVRRGGRLAPWRTGPGSCSARKHLSSGEAAGLATGAEERRGRPETGEGGVEGQRKEAEPPARAAAAATPHAAPRRKPAHSDWPPLISGIPPSCPCSLLTPFPSPTPHPFSGPAPLLPRAI
ncbi:hypothetical protein MC885_009216, partial [Smutsia gigantea]